MRGLGAPFARLAIGAEPLEEPLEGFERCALAPTDGERLELNAT